MKITIGRSSQNTIVVDGRFDTVSANHAEMECMGDGRYLFIDHSTNGTMIGGQKVHNGSVYVREGDRIFLAGAYEVPWGEVTSRAGVRPLSRATVQRNIHGEAGYAPSGRGTDRYAGYDGGGELRPRPPQPAASPSEEELRQWNWGGFLLNWIWGLGNSVWWALLALIPGISLVVSIILGIRGTRAAWEASGDGNYEAFRERQRKWTVAGLIVLGVQVLLYLVAVVVAMGMN